MGIFKRNRVYGISRLSHQVYEGVCLLVGRDVVTGGRVFTSWPHAAFAAKREHFSLRETSLKTLPCDRVCTRPALGLFGTTVRRRLAQRFERDDIRHNGRLLNVRARGIVKGSGRTFTLGVQHEVAQRHAATTLVDVAFVRRCEQRPVQTVHSLPSDLRTRATRFFVFPETLLHVSEVSERFGADAQHGYRRVELPDIARKVLSRVEGLVAKAAKVRDPPSFVSSNSGRKSKRKRPET